MNRTLALLALLPALSLSATAWAASPTEHSSRHPVATSSTQKPKMSKAKMKHHGTKPARSRKGAHAHDKSSH